MSKHTPGPWLVEEDTRPGMEWNRHIVQGPPLYFGICFMANSGGQNPERDQANARLVSAVTDLLEAAQVARDALVSAVRASVDLPEFDPTEHFAVKILDAAIAKATGTLDPKDAA